MKKILFFGAFASLLWSSSVNASVGLLDNVSKLQQLSAPKDYVAICSGVIVSVDQGGMSGTMVISATGEEVQFFNPLGQYVTVGQTVSASVTFCSIIDPPKRTKKRVNAMTSSPDTSTSTTTTSTSTSTSSGSDYATFAVLVSL